MNQPWPSISIVIPTRNRADFLRDCLRSLAKQDFSERQYEVLVVDDGSTDETSSLLGALHTEENFALRYVFQPKRGLNAGRNTGIRETSGDLIIFLDDDVLVEPTFVASYASAAAKYPDVACFGGPIVLQLEARPPRTCGRESLGTELHRGNRDRFVTYVYGANMAARRSAFSEVGLFAETLPGGRNAGGEEMEWQSRYRALGGRIMYLSEATLRHRRSAEDLRLRSLLRAQYGRGRTWPITASYWGRTTSVAAAIWVFVRGVAHGLFGFCWGGLLDAARAAGWASAEIALLMGGDAPPELSWWPRRKSSPSSPNAG